MNLRLQKILNLPFVDNSAFYPQCQAYASLVSYWNSTTNLVSTRDVDNLLTDLIRQSVQPLGSEHLPAESKVLDVGSGAGIPAFPLKFARPDLKFTLLEPRRKKALFLRRVVDELQLKDVEVVLARLEEVSGRPGWQASFDLITTRGTGPAPKLFPLMKPLVRQGGTIWFYKGLAASKEANELSRMTPGSIRRLDIDRNLRLIIVQL